MCFCIESRHEIRFQYFVSWHRFRPASPHTHPMTCYNVCVCVKTITVLLLVLPVIRRVAGDVPVALTEEICARVRQGLTKKTDPTTNMHACVPARVCFQTHFGEHMHLV